jgi:hypothetical protein
MRPMQAITMSGHGLMIVYSLLVNIIDFEFTLDSTGNATSIPIPIRIGVTPTTRFRSSDMFFLNDIFNFIAITSPTQAQLAYVTRYAGNRITVQRIKEYGVGWRGTNCLFLLRFSWVDEVRLNYNMISEMRNDKGICCCRLSYLSTPWLVLSPETCLCERVIVFLNIRR